MAIRKNYWTTFDETPYVAEFSIEFEEFHSIDQVFEFVEAVINTSEENKVCVIDLDNSPMKYIDYLKSRWNQYDTISPFNLSGYKHYSDYFKFPYTELKFYENEKITTAFVSHICNILKNPSYIKFSGNSNLLINEAVNTDNLILAQNHLEPPVKFGMNTFRKNQVPAPVWGLSGQISSDIWLEEVNHHKLWNEDMSEYSFSGKQDNSELAGLNTPGLSSFMRSLKKISQDFGASWHFESTFGNLDTKSIEGYLF